MPTCKLPTRFARSERGNIAIVGALLTLPLMLAVGMAVDFTAATSTKSDMQNALDAAAFAALSLPVSATKNERQATLQSVYVANGGRGSAVIDGDLLNDQTGASLKVNSSLNLPTNFMSVVGTDTMPINVTSSVSKPVKLTTARFRLDEVRGAWDKTIFLMGRTSASAAYQPLMRMVYVAANSSGYGNTMLSVLDSAGVWQDTMEIVCTGMGSCTNNVIKGDGTVEADLSEMEDAYLQFDIAGRYFWPYSYPTLTYRTSDTWIGESMFVEGKQMPENQAVQLLKVFGCTGKWFEHRWEDGGGYSGTTQWDGTDFRYSVNGGCSTNGAVVRLTH